MSLPLCFGTRNPWNLISANFVTSVLQDLYMVLQEWIVRQLFYKHFLTTWFLHTKCHLFLSTLAPLPSSYLLLKLQPCSYYSWHSYLMAVRRSFCVKSKFNYSIVHHSRSVVRYPRVVVAAVVVCGGLGCVWWWSMCGHGGVCMCGGCCTWQRHGVY